MVCLFVKSFQGAEHRQVEGLGDVARMSLKSEQDDPILPAEVSSVEIRMAGVAIHKKENQKMDTKGLHDWVEVVNKPQMEKLGVHPPSLAVPVEPISRHALQRHP